MAPEQQEPENKEVTRIAARRGAAAVALWVCVFLGAPVARAQEAGPWSPQRVSAELRVARGLEETAKLTLPLLGVGADWQLTPTLALWGGALAGAPQGDVAGGAPARLGLGGELALRVTPWPDALVRPYGRFGLGLLLFPGRDFLPGGTRYDGVISFGLGLDLRVSDAWEVGVSAQYIHLSNGQGLGPHNPAFEGLGVGAQARYALREASVARRASPWTSAPPTWTPGGSLEAAAGAADGALLTTARLQLAQRLLPPLLGVVDVEGGELLDAALVEIGGALALHQPGWTAGAHLGRRWFAGFQVAVAALQVEGHLTDDVTLLALGHWERASGGEDEWSAAVGFRAFPTDALMIDLGAGIDGIGQGSFLALLDPYMGAEWQLPWGGPAWSLSLFLERQVSAVSLFGLRGRYGQGERLREVARHKGWRRLR